MRQTEQASHGPERGLLPRKNRVYRTDAPEQNEGVREKEKRSPRRPQQGQAQGYERIFSVQ